MGRVHTTPSRRTAYHQRGAQRDECREVCRKVCRKVCREVCREVRRERCVEVRREECREECREDTLMFTGLLLYTLPPSSATMSCFSRLAQERAQYLQLPLRVATPHAGSMQSTPLCRGTGEVALLENGQIKNNAERTIMSCIAAVVAGRKGAQAMQARTRVLVYTHRLLSSSSWCRLGTCSQCRTRSGCTSQ